MLKLMCEFFFCRNIFFFHFFLYSKFVLNENEVCVFVYMFFFDGVWMCSLVIYSSSSSLGTGTGITPTPLALPDDDDRSGPDNFKNDVTILPDPAD